MRTDQGPVIGIDFGTTNSAVFFTDRLGITHPVRVATGNQAPYDHVLATIALDPLGGSDAMIGLAAEHARVKRRDDLYLAHFKPLLDVQAVRTKILRKSFYDTGEYDFVNQGPLVKTRMELVDFGGDYSREEIVAGAARVLEHLLNSAFEAGADPDSSLWLGTPVRFGSSSRKRLICALAEARDRQGRLLFDSQRALLDRVHFVLEPVAVAAAPGDELEVEGRENVLIFDHGGGTLDLSLIEFEKRADLRFPVAVRELSAGGSTEVAGRRMDEAFTDLLGADPAAKAELNAIADDVHRRQVIERCKIDLSTASSARLLSGNVEVSRIIFERSIEPLLSEAVTEIGETLERAGVTEKDVDWVYMTGGSSLIPRVQQRVAEVFPALAERDRIFRYFAEDPEGVESAITDVARGLANFGWRNELEQIVLWDIEIARENSSDFTVVVPSGTKYESGGDGRPEIQLQLPLQGSSNGGSALGLYEGQLDHRLLFGIADGPSLPSDATVEIRLDRDGLFPSLVVRDPEGRIVERPDPPQGWTADQFVAADVVTLPDDHLEDFFHEDAEYLPVTGYREFQRVPLARRLRLGDFIEWSAVANPDGSMSKSRGRGTIERIWSIEEGEVDEMGGWDVSAYAFTVAEHGKPGSRSKLQTRNGFIRLSPRPGKCG